MEQSKNYIPEQKTETYEKIAKVLSKSYLEKKVDHLKDNVLTDNEKANDLLNRSYHTAQNKMNLIASLYAKHKVNFPQQTADYYKTKLNQAYSNALDGLHQKTVYWKSLFSTGIQRAKDRTQVVVAGMQDMIKIHDEMDHQMKVLEATLKERGKNETKPNVDQDKIEIAPIAKFPKQLQLLTGNAADNLLAGVYAKDFKITNDGITVLNNKPLARWLFSKAGLQNIKGKVFKINDREVTSNGVNIVDAKTGKHAAIYKGYKINLAVIRDLNQREIKLINSPKKQEQAPQTENLLLSSEDKKTLQEAASKAAAEFLKDKKAAKKTKKVASNKRRIDWF